MNDKANTENPHRRYNPLSDKWVLVSPNRSNRPWNGKVEMTTLEVGVTHDKNCYLCAGNTRISGEVNDHYQGCFVFDNDFSALQDVEKSEKFGDDLFKFEGVSGHCKVICYSPDHSKTLPELTLSEIEEIIDTWCAIYTDLEKKFEWVQIFENKGEINGCSNPHPHGQVWASAHIPSEIIRENTQQLSYFNKHQSPMLVNYVKREIINEERVVCINDDWVVVVPYWASWPYETLLLPRGEVSHMKELNGQQKKTLARILKDITTRYDNLFKTSFPYSFGWHCRPADGNNSRHWLMHGHFYPPLLRSATVQKFMVGYELMAEIQRDLTPEQAAETLRNLSDVHYKQAGE